MSVLEKLFGTSEPLEVIERLRVLPNRKIFHIFCNDLDYRCEIRFPTVQAQGRGKNLKEMLEFVMTKINDFMEQTGEDLCSI